MAEKKGVGHAYNVDFLNVVFAASSIFLFLSVIWMVWDDYDREWKNTQRQFVELERQVLQANLQQASPDVDQTKPTAERNVFQQRLDQLPGEARKVGGKIPTRQQEETRLRTRLGVIEPSVLK